MHGFPFFCSDLKLALYSLLTFSLSLIVHTSAAYTGRDQTQMSREWQILYPVAFFIAQTRVISPNKGRGYIGSETLVMSTTL